MKKLLLLFSILLVGVFSLHAQLVGGNTYPINGTDNGVVSFASLRSAIAYLQANGVTGTGQVVLEFTSSYDATLVDAPNTGATKITFPAVTGTSANLGITIRPAAGVTTLLSANVDASGLIDLDGANYITIDGRPGGVGTTSGLTIENLSATTNIGTAAIRFINDAHHNSIKYCSLKSASTHSSSQAGTVFFSTSTGTLGNSNNIIANNTLTAATGFTRTSYQIVSYGSDTAPNASNTISDNNVSNFTFRAIYAFSTGMGDGWTITGNSVFSPTTVTGAAAYGICVLGTGAGHVVSNNFVGGQSPQCGGAAMNTFGFFAIYVTASAISTTSVVQNNTVSNISANYTSTSLSANTSIHHLIYVSGNVDVLGNNLGSQTATDNIVLSTNNTQAFSVFGTAIYVSGAGSVNIKNNKVGGITYNPTGTSASGYIARLVYVNATTVTSMPSLVIDNNIFGGSVANSIKNTGTGRPVTFQGIYLTNYASVTNNTVRNITSSSDAGINGIYLASAIDATVTGNSITNLTNTSATTNATVNGIYAAGTVTGIAVRSNSISNLTTSGTNTTNSSASVLTGISFTNSASTIAATDNVIFNLNCIGTAVTHVIGIASFGGRQLSGNKIYNLYNSNATAGGTIKAIVLRQTGTFNAYNNIISLSGINNDVAVYGFETNGTVGTAANIYHNTIHIGGTISSGSSVSAAIFTNNATPLNLKNNIISIARTGGSGTHNAINNFGAATVTSDYNLYIYPSATTADANSQAFNYGDAGKPASAAVFFADSSSPYYMSVQSTFDSYFKLKGTPIAGITTDIGGNLRNVTTPSLGAYEANTTTLLPVNIKTFNAKLNNGKVNLTWTVGTETNVNHYEVERSANGKDFIKVATVTALGAANYSASDASPLIGINYYRLKGVDNDGTLSLFDELRSVKLTTLENSNVVVYPNPLAGNTINVSLSNYAGGDYKYKLLDAIGKVVQQGTINNNGSETSAITVSNSLNKGIYLLQLVAGDQVIQSKLVKR